MGSKRIEGKYEGMKGDGDSIVANERWRTDEEAQLKNLQLHLRSSTGYVIWLYSLIEMMPVCLYGRGMRGLTKEAGSDKGGRELDMHEGKGTEVEPVIGNARDHQGREYEEAHAIRLARQTYNEEGDKGDKQVRGRAIVSGREERKAH